MPWAEDSKVFSGYTHTLCSVTLLHDATCYYAHFKDKKLEAKRHENKVLK